MYYVPHMCRVTTDEVNIVTTAHQIHSQCLSELTSTDNGDDIGRLIWLLMLGTALCFTCDPSN